MSTTASAMSGTLASVAPYESAMSASMPWAASALRVSSGYSVLTRRRPGRPAPSAASSVRLCAGESAPTASTMRAGLAVAFE